MREIRDVKFVGGLKQTLYPSKNSVPSSKSAEDWFLKYLSKWKTISAEISSLIVKHVPLQKTILSIWQLL
jgi:hypothetical protein